MASYPDEYDLTEADLEGMTPIAQDSSVNSNQIDLSQSDLEGMSPITDADLEGMNPLNSDQGSGFLDKAADTAAAGGAGIVNATLGMSESVWRTPDMFKRGYGALYSMVTGKDLPDKYNPISYITDGFKIGGYDVQSFTDVADNIGGAMEQLPSMSQTFADVAQAGKEADEAFNGALGGEFTKLGQVVTDPEAWAGFIGQAVPSLFAAWKSGGSIPFMAWLEGMEGADSAREFEKRTGEKMDDRTFMSASAATGIANGLLEKLGLESILKGKGSLVKKFFGGMIGEGATEGAQGFTGNLVEQYLYNPDASLSEGVLPGVMGGMGTGGPAGFVSGVADKMAPPVDNLDAIRKKVVDDIDTAKAEEKSLGLPAPVMVVSPDGTADTQANMQAAEEMGLRVEGQQMSDQLGAPTVDPGIVDYQAPNMDGMGAPERGTRGSGEFQNWEGNIPFEDQLSPEESAKLSEMRLYAAEMEKQGNREEAAKTKKEIDTFMRLTLGDPMTPIDGKVEPDNAIEFDQNDSYLDMNLDLPASENNDGADSPDPAQAPSGEVISQIDELRTAANETNSPFVKAKLNRDADLLQAKLDGEKPKLTKEERARKRKEYDATEEPLDMLIRKMGGLDTDLESDYAGRFSHLNEKGKKNIENPGRDNGGVTLDDVLERANQEGYDFKDKADLEEALGRMEQGDPVYSGNRSAESINYEGIQNDTARLSQGEALSPEDRALNETAKLMDPERYERIIEPDDYKPSEKQLIGELADRAMQHAPGQTSFVMGQDMSDAETRELLQDILNNEPEPKQQPEKGTAFQQPHDYKMDSYNRAADEEGLTERQRERFTPEDVRDDVTGMHKAEDRIPTMNRARDYIDANESAGSYVDIDMRNLGGLNSAFSHTGANKHFKAFADIVQKNMANIGNAVTFRHGGDEMSVIAPDVGVDEMTAAMAAAQKEIDQYVKDNDLADLPHAKYEGAAADLQDISKGTGIYFGVSMIDTDISNSEIIQLAEEQTEAQKPKKLMARMQEERSDVNQQTTEETGAGQDAAGTGTEGADGANQEGQGQRGSQDGSKSAAEITAAASEATGHIASEAQINAGPGGNFKKGHVFNLHGFKISIENEAGTKRNRMTPKSWPVLAHHYGDLTGTTGADGDPIDVFIKKDTDIEADNPIYVINQKNKDGSFDEVKVMMGFESADDAKQGYTDSYSDDFTGFDSIVETTAAELKAWANEGDTSKPFESAAEFELNQQTDEDIQAAEEAQAEADKQKADAEAKATADEQVDDFVLAGSDSAVDQAEARGQQNMFDQTDETAREMTEEGRAKDGKPINPGDKFRTLTGRETTPYPKQKREKYSSQWLIDNATAEAESRGDDFNAPSFRGASILKSGELTPADRDGMLMYLFGEQPSVIPPITKPLTEGSANSADNDTQAKAILDAANVTGKDRLDIMAKVRSGEYTMDDLQAAYPADDAQIERDAEDDVVISDEDMAEMDAELNGIGEEAGQTPQEDVSISEYGSEFETGKPVKFTYMRNTEKAPDMGSRFQQDIEPTGRYMTHKSPSVDADAVDTWETGEISFKNPIVIPINTVPGNIYDENSWKARLSAEYDGKTGKALSDAIVKDGHDGIVTVDLDRNGKPRNTSEIVDLTGNKNAKTEGSISFSKKKYEADLAEDGLYITHNLSIDNLIHADKVGGLAVPSLAITNASTGFDSFGEISLIADKSITLDPYAKTFGADIYSPRYPQVVYEVDIKKYNEIVATMNSKLKEVGLDVIRGDIESRGIQDLYYDSSVRYMYLESSGKDPKLTYKKKESIPMYLHKFKGGQYEIASDPKFKADAEKYYKQKAEKRAKSVSEAGDGNADAEYEFWLNDWMETFFNEDGDVRLRFLDELAYTVSNYSKPRKVDTYALDKKISGKLKTTKAQNEFKAWIEDTFSDVIAEEKIFKGFTPSGNRKYIAHTLDNVVSEMKKKLRGGENFNYGIGTIRSAAAPQFKTIKKIQSERGKIVSKDVMDSLKEESSNDFDSVVEALRFYYKYESNSFGFLDAVAENLFDMARGRGLPDFENVPSEVRREAAEFITKLKDMPTEYFETKMQRAVTLDEFVAAVVPKGTPNKVKDILKKHGLKVKTYDPKADNGRAESIRKIKGIFFSKSSHEPGKGGTAKGITKAESEEAVAQFFKETGKPDLIDVLAAPTKESIMAPEYLRMYGNDKIAGYYTDRPENQGGGAIVLILEDLDSVEDAVKTLRHEWVVHHGLNTFNKADKKKIIDRVRSSRGEMSLKKAWAHVDENYADAAPDKQAEEMLAYMAENKPTRLSKLWNDLVLMVENMLKKLGLMDKGKVTKAEVVQFIEDLTVRVGSGAKQQTFDGEGAYQNSNSMEESGDVSFSKDPATGETGDIFYSQMQSVLDKKLPGKGTAPQFKQQIQNMANKGEFKQEELEWSGVEEWLDSQPLKRLTKQDVIDYLAANQIQIEEVVKGEITEADENLIAYEEIKRAVDMDDDLYFDDRGPNGYSYVMDAGLEETLYEGFPEELANQMSLEYDSEDVPEGVAKFSEWQLPGGENYRELLLVLPEKDYKSLMKPVEKLTELPAEYELVQDGDKYYVSRSDTSAGIPIDGYHETRQAAVDSALALINNKLESDSASDAYRVAQNSTYTSPHWDEENILAHIRYNERTDADGNRVLFIEETQSDWHQAGRKKGYEAKRKGEITKDDVVVKFVPPVVPDGGNPENYPGYYEYFDTSGNMITRGPGRQTMEEATADAMGWLEARPMYESTVPDAPFKTTWPLLAMKRMIRHAAENGFDKIAWTTGEQQAERYDLSKQVDSIAAAHLDSGNYSVQVMKDGDLVADKTMKESELEDFVGKDLARKIIDNKEVQAGIVTNFSGVDLQVGGEGMKGFYDQILPKTINKYVKKWGGKVGETNISENEYEDIVHSLDITPAMKSAAMEGQVMFSKKKPIQKIDERAKGAAKKVKDAVVRYTRRQLTKEGLLPDSAFQAKLINDSEKNVGEGDLSALVYDFEKAVSKAYGKSYNKIDESDLLDVNAYIAGEKGVALPEGLHRELDHMRAYLDRLSAGMQVAMADMMEIEASKLSEKDQAAFGEYVSGRGGYLPESMAKHFNLYQTIEKNKGSYLTRSYQAFDDKGWQNRVMLNGDLIRRAKAYIAEQDPGLSPDEVIGAVRAILESAYDSGNFMSMMSKGSKMGAKDTSIITKRKSVPPVIRELLGEYKDPKLNFTRSASKMQWFLANHHLLMNLRKDGLGTYMFEKPTGEFAAEIAAKGSETMNPINGLYTTRDIKQGLEDAAGNEPVGDLMREIIRYNSVIKYGKTILAPTTQARNFQSAAMFTIMNGHYDWSYAKKAYQVAKADLFTKDKAWRDYIQHLIGLGVMHNSPYAGELRDAIDDVLELNIYKKGLMQKPKQALNFVQKTYQLGDDFWKVIGFENEKQQMIESGMSEAEAEKFAAKRIRDGYPTYSMVPRGIKKIHKWLLIGTFVSFPYEIIRTSYNQVGFMREDLAADRKKMAARRMLGMALAGSTASALSMLSMMMMGMDDDDDEAVRRLQHEWSRNSQLVYTGYDENGMPQYYDISYLDPYTYLKKPVTALMNGNNEGIDEKLLDAGTEFLEPFIGTDIAAGALLEIWANKKDSGGKIYNEQAAPWEKAKSIMNHARKAAQPGVMSNIERMILAVNESTGRSGRKYDVGDEMVALVGHRISTLNIPQSMVYKTFQFVDDKGQATRLLSYVSGSGEKITDEEMRDATNQMLKARSRVYNDMIKLTQAARKLNMSEDDLADVMDAAGMSKRDVDYILDGEVAPWDMPFSYGEKGLTRAMITAHDEERRKEVEQEYERRMEIIDGILDDYYR